MNLTNGLMVIAVIAVVVSVVNLFGLVSVLPSTGFASENATGGTDLTIVESLDIAFYVSNVSWGEGYVDAEFSNATLNTSDDGQVGAATGTEWVTSTPSGLILQNIGNVDANVSLVTDKNATDFICGSVSGCTSPAFQWMFDNTNGGCTYQEGTGWSGTYVDVCKVGESCDVGAGDGRAVCNGFKKVAGTTTYEFLIDIQVVVPADAEPEQKIATITAGAEKA